MNELESLALLIADLNTQVRSLQAENAELQKMVKLYSDGSSTESSFESSGEAPYPEVNFQG